MERELISIKINWKVVFFSIFIAILMYPRTIENFVRTTEAISIAKKLSSSTVQSNSMVLDSNKTKIVFMFDGGWMSVYSDAYEVMRKYNYKGSVSVIPSRIDEEEFITYRQLANLYLEGWELINHSYSHNENSNENTDEILADFNRARQWMKNRYVGTLSDMVVMPYGEINPYLLAQLKAAGYRNVRTAENIIMLDKTEIAYYPAIAVNLLTDMDVKDVQSLLTNTNGQTKAIIIILNKIGDRDDGFGMTYSKEKFEEIIEFIDNNKDEFQVITYSQLFE